MITVVTEYGTCWETAMLQTVPAEIDASGEVRLLEQIVLDGPRRALVTILDQHVAESPPPSDRDSAILSQDALAQDWNRPEEDAAWSHLQPGKSS